MKENRETTIYDIARELGISPSTVSRALKDHPGIKKETQRRVREAAKKMGYRHNKFASSLRLNKTHTLGVIVPKLNSYFMATAIAGIQNVANKYGYSIIISQSQENEKKEAEQVVTLYNSRVDGLLVSLAYNTNSLNHFELLLNKGIPLVFFDRVFECKGCTRVVIDNNKAGYEIVSHLISQGCRRIMYVGGNLLRNVYTERLNGYKRALEDNGLPFDDSLVIINNLSEKDGEDVGKQILKMKKRPDAVFAANDTTAVSVIMTLKQAGLSVPEDIAVAGFNNEPISRIVQPNLTTVDYPSYEIGELATETLIKKLNSEKYANPLIVILDHKLIIRESTLRKNSFKDE